MAATTALILPESPSMKKAVSLINAIDTGRFPRLLTRILQKLHLKAENSFSEEEEEKLQAAFSLEKQDLHLALETISFILEQAVYHNVKPAALQQQLEAIHLQPDKAEAFGNAWSSMGQETVEKFRQRILAPHKLETVGWQLNLQMAHSAQAKLRSPQAVLQLGVSNEDSKSWIPFSWANRPLGRRAAAHKNKGCFQGRLSSSVGEASAFGSDHDLRVLGSSPASGSLLSGESVSPSPSLAFSQINTLKKKTT
ncbi:COMM domain-containing protein 10 isoform X1 [Ailuropoda melanoleuca]|uniref:COMM domain containing 10 n=2 Tax=Ailuropoda melanoleuca TaxID=9646 RepID=A0A7N5KPC3_AILME|nr:COMM domain-containing protein 10 isoform X1 [Ailuropoda melanoleuca]